MNIHDDRRFVIAPRSLLRILDVIDNAGDVNQPDRSAFAISNDDVLVIVARHDLVVGADRENLLVAFEVAFCLIHVRRGQRRADIFETQTVGGEGRRIDLNTNAGFLSAADANKADSR